MSRAVRLAAVAAGLVFASITLASITLAAAAQLVVVDSNSSDIAVGAMLDSAGTLSISEGKHIVVIGGDGKTRTIRGPFSGTLDDSADGSENSGAVLQSLAKFVTADRSRTRVGAVRAAATTPVPWEPSLVPVDRSGRVCLTGAGAQFWRPKSATASTLIIKEIRGTAGTLNLPWPAGADRLPWPEAIAPRHGASYMVRFGNSTRATRIDIVMVADEAPTPVHRIASFIAGQCERQARSLLQELVAAE